MATTPNLISAPPVRLLPLSLSRDLHVVFVYKKIVVDDDGNPVKVNGQFTYEEVDVPEGTVKLEINTSGISGMPDVSEFEAEVDGSDITVHVDHTVTDRIPKGRLWRLVITYTNEVDDVLVNGTTIRSDGGR